MKPRSAARRHLPTSPFKDQSAGSPVETFAVGDRVTHDTHGLGRVAAVESESAVLIEFSTGQVRLTSPFRKLTKL